jgi:hypothetical protein
MCEKKVISFKSLLTMMACWFIASKEQQQAME